MPLKEPQAKGKTVSHLIGDRKNNLDLLSIYALSNQPLSLVVYPNDQLDLHGASIATSAMRIIDADKK